MKDYACLNHTKWDCKYHVVFIAKRRKKQIYGSIRKHLGEIFRERAKTKGAQDSKRVFETRSCSHVCQHSTKSAVSDVVGYINQREEFHFRREEHDGEKEEFYGGSSWAKGFFVARLKRK